MMHIYNITGQHIHGHTFIGGFYLQLQKQQKNTLTFYMSHKYVTINICTNISMSDVVKVIVCGKYILQ